MSAPALIGCPACGLLQELPPLERGQEAVCPRCEAVVRNPDRVRRARSHAIAWSVSALLLFPIAISLPIVQLEQFGARTTSSVLGGTVKLLAHGEWLVGGVVFLCSVLLPATKLLGILGLALGYPRGDRARAKLHHSVEVAGRWGMLDVFLIAVFVAALKIGDLVEVTPGPGALAFSLLVGLSLLASASFDPHDFWSVILLKRSNP